MCFLYVSCLVLFAFLRFLLCVFCVCCFVLFLYVQLISLLCCFLLLYFLCCVYIYIVSRLCCMRWLVVLYLLLAVVVYIYVVVVFVRVFIDVCSSSFAVSKCLHRRRGNLKSTQIVHRNGHKGTIEKATHSKAMVNKTTPH